MEIFTALRNKTMQDLTLFSSISPMMLPTDDTGIAIRPTPTTDLDWTMTNNRTRVMGVQVFVRSISWVEGYNTLHDIHDLWHGQSKPFLDGLTRLEATTNPNFVGVDDRNRYEFTAIYELHINERND